MRKAPGTSQGAKPNERKGKGATATPLSLAIAASVLIGSFIAWKIFAG